MVALIEHFQSEGPGRASEWARQHRWFIKAKHDNQRREELADKVDNNATAAGIAVSVAATTVQIKEFETKLDSYDAAVVTALMDNQELLDAVQGRIDALLLQAHMMEDGRRVFLTEDGTQVFDVHGGEVTADEMDFGLIPATAPTWEDYQGEVETEQALTSERAGLITYQEKLDAAREGIADGEISEVDLEELDADLLEAMPYSVRDHVSGLEMDVAKSEHEAEITDQKVQSTGTVTSNDTGAPAPVPL
jgi:hypothetical protein